MTPVEVMKKLDKKESDFTIEKTEMSFDSTTEIIYVLDNTKYRNRNASIDYVFWGIGDLIEDQSLKTVRVTFTEDISREEANEMSQLIQSEVLQAYEIETIEETQRSYPGAIIKCSSKTRTHDLPQEIQDKTNAYARKLLRDAKAAGGEFMFDIEKYTFTHSVDPALSHMAASFIKEGESSTFKVIFDGEGIVYTKLYSRLAEEAGIE